MTETDLAIRDLSLMTDGLAEVLGEFIRLQAGMNDLLLRVIGEMSATVTFSDALFSHIKHQTKQFEKSRHKLEGLKRYVDLLDTPKGSH